MKKRKLIGTACVCLASMFLLCACGDDFGDGSTGTYAPIDIRIDPTEEIVLPNTIEKRKLPDSVPEAAEPAKNPGSRRHFLFTVGEEKFVFTETENLWMYNQSKIQGIDTQFMLEIKGDKVVLALPSETVDTKEMEKVYSDDFVKIYRKTDAEEVEEGEVMYLTVCDLTYEVTLWDELVSKRQIKLEDLYKELAQVGAAIEPADDDEDLTDVLTGMRVYPVFGEYKFALREGIPYSGYVFCSPNTTGADYDDLSILMSMVVPEWDSYATITIGAIPDYRDRLEDTGEKFGDYPIYVDYQGDLKYYLFCDAPEDGDETDAEEMTEKERQKQPVTDVCVMLDAVPGNATVYTDTYTPEEAKYIFELFFTED